MIAKDAIVAASGWSRDGLHVGIGLLLFLVLSAPVRARTGSVAAWGAVLTIALANEVVDLRNDLMLSGVPRTGESWHDIVYTMTLPTLVLTWTHLLHALVRYPQRVRSKRSEYETPSPRRWNPDPG